MLHGANPDEAASTRGSLALQSKISVSFSPESFWQIMKPGRTGLRSSGPDTQEDQVLRKRQPLCSWITGERERLFRFLHRENIRDNNQDEDKDCHELQEEVQQLFTGLVIKPDIE